MRVLGGGFDDQTKVSKKVFRRWSEAQMQVLREGFSKERRWEIKNHESIV